MRQEDIAEARDAYEMCLNEITYLEADMRHREAAIVRKSRLPFLQSQLRHATEAKLPLWRGGEPRSSLLGMRHCSAQTVLPGEEGRGWRVCVPRLTCVLREDPLG